MRPSFSLRSARFALIAMVSAMLLVTSSCTRSVAVRPTGGTADLITRIELSRSLASNAYDAVRQLRPSMLVGRGRTTLTGEEVGVIVYLDDRRLGSASQLRNLTVNMIYEIRYVSASAAQIKWGQGHPQGVISVTTLRATDPVR